MRGVLLVGSGAREVAIARKIMGGSSSVRLHCISSVTNPQIETLCHKYFEQSPNNVGGILSVVKIYQSQSRLLVRKIPWRLGWLMP